MPGGEHASILELCPFNLLATPALCPCLPQVKLCLVVNKIDRLILELCLTPLEAYERLKAIIAHVNMIVSSFHSEKYISGVLSAVVHYEGSH